jgi:hypothetical protein
MKFGGSLAANPFIYESKIYFLLGMGVSYGIEQFDYKSLKWKVFKPDTSLRDQQSNQAYMKNHLTTLKALD